ncbi:hypothetical protein IQ22_00210 [Pseudomonas duriflava]|uniref:Imelysin-like domain-containing protein n=1 Tax=Pseudomonas duriflava TaxID=459528 RepID=A0A562QP46_9PSED|nr:imelysin family protein [Pseudomonas duriflava]TWI58504.1 hypothetical protein IQ22_00210 [Pseudomonas duriflava]
MFRPRFLLTGLALVLGACSPQDPQAQTSAALAEQVLLPAYSRWADADRALSSSAIAFCSGQEDLEKARAAFFTAQKAWAELQPLLIGPLAENNTAWQVQFYPDKKNLVARQVEQLLKTNSQIDKSTLDKASVVVQGLTAYEYILFDSNIELANAEQKARYCPLLMAIGEHQQTLAQTILAKWKETDGMLAQLSKFPNQRYADAQEAIADLLRVQVTALDSLKKKLGVPLGRQSKGIPQPFQAEAWRSESSLLSIAASLAGAQALWNGVEGRGLRTLLPSEQKPLAERIDSAYADSKARLDELQQQSLQYWLAEPTGIAKLNAFYDSLNTVHRLHESELAKALGIQLGFNANDGD